MAYEIQEIKQVLEQIQLINPPKTLFENEWVIALIGVFFGFILGLIGQYLKDRWEKNKIINSAIINIFDEVFENCVHTNKDKVQKMRSTLNSFRVITTNNNPPTAGPSLAHFDINHIDFYQIHSKDFYLLKPRLRERLTHFYSLMKSIHASSKKLEQYFRDFYKQTGIVGSEDICMCLEKLITQTESANKTGTQVLAIIMKDYNYSGRLPALTTESELFIRSKINDFLKKNRIGDLVTISDISQEIKLPNMDLLIAKVILDDFRFKEETYGMFKIINTNLI